MAHVGFSLVELLVVVAVAGLLTAWALPTFDRPIRDSQFHAFAAELTANVILARAYAQMSGQSVELDFTETAQYRYRCSAHGVAQRQLLCAHAWEPGYPSRVRNQLPASPLPHPAGQGMLDRAMSSTHAPKVIFAPGGSSNATLVFSDGAERSVCVIVSGQSGRFRVFLWDEMTHAWLDYY